MSSSEPTDTAFDFGELRRALQDHRPSTADEEQYVADMRALLDTSEDPLHRRSFAPGHFTASAFVVSPSRSALLLIHHRKLRRWLQPGGHIEASDTDFVAAARREVEEETGLRDLELLDEDRPLLDVDVHAIPAHGEEPAHLHHDLRVAFVAVDRNLDAGEEVHDARWVAFDDVTSIDSDASVLRALARLRVQLSRSA